MKNIIVLISFFMLAGCTAWHDNTKMDDFDLCSRIGYDNFHGYNGVFKSDIMELKRRLNMGTFTLSQDECISLVNAGYAEEENFSNRVNAMTAALSAGAAEVDRQQNSYTAPEPVHMPVVTRCNQFGSSINCTTY